MNPGINHKVHTVKSTYKIHSTFLASNKYSDRFKSWKLCKPYLYDGRNQVRNLDLHLKHVWLINFQIENISPLTQAEFPHCCFGSFGATILHYLPICGSFLTKNHATFLHYLPGSTVSAWLPQNCQSNNGETLPVSMAKYFQFVN